MDPSKPELTTRPERLSALHNTIPNPNAITLALTLTYILRNSVVSLIPLSTLKLEEPPQQLSTHIKSTMKYGQEMSGSRQLRANHKK